MKLAVRAKALGKKLTLMTTAFVLAVSSLTALTPFVLAEKASAVGSVTISNVAELCDAIDNQADGQVWTIAAGAYGVDRCNSISAEGRTGWYLPITADNLTINGIGNPTLYGTGFAANGAWQTQNFVTVFGDNVTINGLTLMPKVEPNKTIEVLGSNFTLRNSTIAPNTLTNPAEYNSIADPQDRSDLKEWGGSLYFSHAGNHTVENVTIKNSGISFRYAPAGTHIAFSNVKLDYSTSVDWINNYRYSSGFTNAGNSITGSIAAVYHVSSAQNNLESVLAAVKDGDVIEIDSDLTLSKQATVNKAVTINGNNHTVTGSFVKTNNGNNSVIGVWSDNVTINDLVVDAVNGTTNQLHGINVFEASNVKLNNITARNGLSGVAVNASTVTINGISTSGNVWHGINVDKSGAHLTIKGANSHNEVLALYADDKTIGLVDDVDAQYATVDNFLKAGDRAYRLKLTTPVLESPSANGYTTSNVFDFEWSDVNDAVSYEFQNSLTGANVNGVLSNINYSATSGVSKLHSAGAADGSVRYWQVRAVDAYGAKSDWSAPWKMTIDMTAPVAPVINNSPVYVNATQANNQATWTHSGTDVQKFEYREYRNMAEANADEDGKTASYWTQTKSATTRSQTVGQSWTGEKTLYYRVVAIDAAGNRSVPSALGTVIIDKSGPATTITGPAMDGQIMSGSIQVTGEAVTTGVALKSHWFEIKNPDGTMSYSYDMSATDTTYSFDLDTSKGDGVYTIRYVAADKAGNRSDMNGSTIRTVIVDNTPITVSAATFTQNGNVITPNVVVSEEPVSQSWVQVSGPVGGVSISDPNTLAPAFTVLQDGAYKFNLTTFDGAGNPSVSVFSFTYTTPVVPSSTDDGGDDVIGSEDESGFTGPAFISPATADQLGANDQADSEGKPAVEGTSTEKNLAQAVNNTDGSAFGLAWYWWLLIVAGLATILWWIIAAARRRQEEN